MPSGVQHVSSMEWHDGILWLQDWHDSTGDIYLVDFDAGEISQTITGNRDVGGSSWCWMATIPTTDGEKKMLFADIGNSGAYLVDMAGVRADGQTGGNVETQLDNTFNNFHNGGVWVNGYLIWITHAVAGKGYTGHADRMGPGHPVGLGQRVEWLCEPPAGYSYDGLTYNTATGELLTGSETNVIAFREQAPGDVAGEFGVSDVVRGGVGQSRALSLTGSSTTQSWFRLFDEARPCRVEWWFYDDGETSSGDGKRMYASVSNDSTSDKHGLGVKTTATSGDSEYQRWNSTDLWESTGVSRPSNPQWVIFAWIATGHEMKMQISKDYGRTWEDAGTKTSHATTIRQMGTEARSGSGKYGHINILPQFSG